MLLTTPLTEKCMAVEDGEVCTRQAFAVEDYFVHSELEILDVPVRVFLCELHGDWRAELREMESEPSVPVEKPSECSVCGRTVPYYWAEQTAAAHTIPGTYSRCSLSACKVEREEFDDKFILRLETR